MHSDTNNFKLLLLPDSIPDRNHQEVQYILVLDVADARNHALHQNLKMVAVPQV